MVDYESILFINLIILDMTLLYLVPPTYQSFKTKSFTHY